MEIKKRLLALYGENQPILLDEIKAAMSEYSTPQIFRYIKNATEMGQLKRYSESLYFIPKPNAHGQASLSSEQVIEKKYLKSNGETIGFYSGITLLNAIGGTRQMAFAPEVVTNAESARVREVFLGKSRVVLRRSRCKVTSENKVILQVLELCNKYVWDKEAAQAIAKYAKNNGVTIKDILMYAKYYPAKAFKSACEVLYDTP